jgi:Mg2+/Co2+ transporter CorB
VLKPRVSIRELNALLDTNLSVDKAKTLNGLILEELQSIPTRDVSIKIDNILIDIIQITNRTIKLVRLTKIDPS